MIARALCVSLLFAATASTQDAPPTPTPPSPDVLAQEKLGAEELRAQRIAELTAQLQKLQQELAHLRKIQAQGGMITLVQGYLTDRTLTPHSVAAGPVARPPEAVRQGARLLGDEEKAGLAPDVVFLVDRQPVTKAEFDALFNYFKSYPQDVTDDQLKTQVIKALVATKATAAAFQNSGQKAKDRITQIKARLDRGDDFATVATEMSQCPSAKDGGDLNFFGRADMVPTFAERAFSMKVSEVSGIVQSPFGYHIIKVTGYEKGATPGEDRVRASHILALYDPDQQRVREVTMDVNAGKVDLAFVSDEYRRYAPDGY